MLTRLGSRMRRWALAVDTRTNVVGLARTLLACGTLSTLVASPFWALFPGDLHARNAACSGWGAASFFCLLPQRAMPLTGGVAIAMLLIVASGWRPRLTGIPHWWISASYFATSGVLDGGDQITMILTLALIPVTLVDERRWHWFSAPTPLQPAGTAATCGRLVARIALALVRVQVACIYLEAGMAKTRVAEWRDGTAVYYWFHDPVYGLTGLRSSLLTPLLGSAIAVAALTWGVVALELTLFAGLLMERRWRAPLLVAGILMHVGIGVVHGLYSFGLAMTAALLLYLRPVEMPFVPPRWPYIVPSALRVQRRWRTIGPPVQQPLS